MIKKTIFRKKIILFLINILFLFLIVSCQQEPYNITWVDYDGTIIDTQYIENNDIENPENPYRYGYTFISWQKERIENSNDFNYIAKYKINEYTVTFKDNTGQILSIQKIEHGQDAIPPSEPSVQGYEFTGWDKKHTNITTNTVITAVALRVYSQGELYAILSESVFKVEILDRNYNVVSQGSGFFIKEDGTFITNAHVVEDGWYGRIDQDENAFDIDIVEIITYNEYYDYAILKVENLFNSKKFKPVTFSNDYNVGDEVYSMGYPLDSYISRISKGIILEETTFEGVPYIVTNAYINNGSSGGVTVNRFGQVIGISTAGFSDGTFGSIPTNVFYNSINNINLFPKTIKDYFHPSTSIILNSSNFTLYFNVSVINTDVEFFGTAGVTISYDIYVTPLGDYEYPTFGINLSIFISTNYSTVIFDTLYDWTDSSSHSLKISDYQVYKKSVSTTIIGDVYSVNTYSWDISVSGILIIYD